MLHNLHVPNAAERVREADMILEGARLRVEEYRNVIGPDNYLMASGWLTL